MLDQRLATIPQHYWVGKLLGFDFSIEYKAGNINTVADALSRLDTEEVAVLAISGPRFNLIDWLRQAHDTDLALVTIKAELTERAALWSLIDGMVAFQGRLYPTRLIPLRRAVHRCPVHLPPLAP